MGHVFQGRYKAILVEKDSYLLALCRYVVLNPVRAGMVRSAREYRWSSYRATAGWSATPELLCTDWLLAQFGVERSEAQHRYKGKSGSDSDFPQCCMWKEVVLICASWRPIIEPTMHNSHARREGLWAKLKT